MLKHCLAQKLMVKKVCWPVLHLGLLQFQNYCDYRKNQRTFLPRKESESSLNMAALRQQDPQLLELCCALSAATVSLLLYSTRAT